MNTPSQRSQVQQSEEVRRRRDGRPDKTAMSNEERHAAGLMTRQEAAEHERLAAITHGRAADRVKGPAPDGPWASDPDRDSLTVWKAWQAAGHLAKGCFGWSQDSRDGGVLCSCGEAFPAPEEAAAE